MQQIKNHKINLNSQKDRLFLQKRSPMPFSFTKEVVEVFDDMVSRSVPLYEHVVQSISEWSFLFHQKNTAIYDIGCSTGTVIAHLCQIFDQPVRILGIDTSKPMLEKAKTKISPIQKNHIVTFHENDACEFDFKLPASVVTMNYTLQFLPVIHRRSFIQKIYDTLTENGIFIISEKTQDQFAILHQAKTTLYENFKLNSGYSRNEIEKKKEALDQVLIPFSKEEHYRYLKEAGFRIVDTIVQWNNFSTFIAIK